MEDIVRSDRIAITHWDYCNYRASTICVGRNAKVGEIDIRVLDSRGPGAVCLVVDDEKYGFERIGCSDSCL